MAESTAPLTRRASAALVLSLLATGPVRSRAEMARVLRLSRVTISEAVSGLLADGLVEETASARGGVPGRPARGLGIAPTGPAVVALDLSDPLSFSGVVASLDGTVRLSHDRPLSGAVGVEAQEQALELAVDLVRAAGVPVVGVGIGVPGVVDAGVVRMSEARAWHDLPLASLVEQATGLPVEVHNDAALAAEVSSARPGALGAVLVVSLAHGVGAGVAVAGTRVSGGASTGEIGHLVVPSGREGMDLPGDEPPCRCGRDGCLEASVSVARLEARLGRVTDSVSRAAVLDDAGRQLGAVLAPIVSFLDVQEVVLSGRTSVLSGAFAAGVVTALGERLPRSPSQAPEVRAADPREHSVLDGAVRRVVRARLEALA